MDATVMNVNSGMYRVVSQKCNPNFGGKDFDKVLVQHFLKEFQRYLLRRDVDKFYKLDWEQRVDC